METVAPFKEIIDAIKASGGDAFKYCYQCGMCDTVCPWNRVRNFSMRKIVREATFGLTEIESEDIWRCTTCGKCPQVCPRDVKQIESGVALRRIATEYDVFPDACEADSARVAAQPARRGQSRSARSARSAPTGRRASASSPSPRGWNSSTPPAATCPTTRAAKKIAGATVEILQKAGVDFGILGTEESCCGESIRKTGDEALFKTPGPAEHRRLHRQRGEEDPGLLAALLSQLQERVPRVHGALRGRPHLAVHLPADRRGPAGARRRSTRRR